MSTLELYVHTHEVVRDRYCGEQYAQAMNINMNNVITFIWGHILPLLCCVQQLIGPGGNTPSHTHAHTHTAVLLCGLSHTSHEYMCKREILVPFMSAVYQSMHLSLPF